MLPIIRKYIADNQMLSPYGKVIVGLSGGADSMALLDVLMLFNYNCVAAHCNFHLRGEESERDAHFVRNWCKSVDIPFEIIDFDTRQYAADRKISIEMAARELRYDWFDVICKQYSAEAIVVAHHRDDTVETVLLNLIRGTGIKGLTGISAKSGNIVRPFLSVSREQILSYIEERRLPFVKDSTNDETVYRRNTIRLNVLPMLRRLNPSVDSAIWRMTQNMEEAEKVYRESIGRSIKSVFLNNKIDLLKLRQTPSPKSVLFELLTPFGFNASVIEEITESIESESGKQYFAENYRLIKDRKHFILEKTNEQEVTKDCYLIDKRCTVIKSPIRLKIRVLKNDHDFLLHTDNRFLYLDAKKIKFPLKLRKWQTGDWFIPLGMTGKKKVSDFFTDNKFNLLQKEQSWILTSGEDIVWIVGERSDNRFRITSYTQKIIEIELLH